MKQKLKKIIKKSLYLNACLYIFYNLRIRLKLIFNFISTDSGSTHASLNLDDSLAYIENVVRDYQRVAGLTEFTGNIAEIGPGDSAGVALLLLAKGAQQVDLADRFYSQRNHTQHTEIYKVLAQKYPQLTPALANINTTTTENIPGINRYYGDSASGERFFETHKGYDCIISRSVLEHVDHPERVINGMYDALSPDGVLIHKVDLRDHGMFTPYDQPLKFLELPQFLYYLMTYGVGYPNRFLFHRYKQVLLKLNPKTEFFASGLHGVEPLAEEFPVDNIPADLKKQAVDFVEQHRHKFAKEFRTIPADELMISSFFFVCRKV